MVYHARLVVAHIHSGTIPVICTDKAREGERQSQSLMRITQNEYSKKVVLIE